ncbi:cation channel sperm-associated auxiliary subunit TMEM249-like [Engraulis encrasicolus]|uniref:cation channel sperm-associated auxiliary subunit TMEM249-like n=1 Tax=Engraulis encrasicolus TaxID=184585 RepID=UPI002FD72BEA
MTEAFFERCRDRVFATNQVLTEKILKNPSYPFVKLNNVFVYEYFHENLVKGALLLLASASTMLISVYKPSSNTSYSNFLVFGFGMAVCLLWSGAFRRRLVIDYENEEYRFYKYTHLCHRGPLNQIYIRLVAQKAGSKQMFRLILNGNKIEPRTLCGFSEKYMLLECQGRTIASTLKVNYFDFQDTSQRHCVIHRPTKH